MPQMAPIMWLPLFILILSLLLVMKATIYFTDSSPLTKPSPTSAYFNTNWPW